MGINIIPESTVESNTLPLAFLDAYDLIQYEKGTSLKVLE